MEWISCCSESKLCAIDTFNRVEFPISKENPIGIGDDFMVKLGHICEAYGDRVTFTIAGIR